MIQKEIKGEKIHIFSPLEIYKIAKKGLQIFPCGAHTLTIINFTLGKNIIKKGGGAKV